MADDENISSRKKVAEEDRKEAEESDVNVEREHDVEGERMEVANEEDRKEAEASVVNVETEHVEGEIMEVANEEDRKEAEKSDIYKERENVEGERMKVAHEEDMKEPEKAEVANKEDRKEAEKSDINVERKNVEGEVVGVANEEDMKEAEKSDIANKEDRKEAEKSDINVERKNVEGERVEVANEEKVADKVKISSEGEHVEGKGKAVGREIGQDGDVGGKKKKGKRKIKGGITGTGRKASRSVVGAVPTNNIGSSSISGTELTASATETSKLNMQEVHVETGEENEKTVFASDAILYEFIDGGWKERGEGEVKLNLNRTGDNRARFVMRARGNYRLILNASIYVDMAVKEMGKKGATFVCVNGIGEGQIGPSTFALKFKDEGIRNLFSANVNSLKLRLQICLTGDFGVFDMDLRR